MNLNLTANIKMPDHELRRQVIELCKKVEKPLLKLSTKDYVENGLGHLVERCLMNCSIPSPDGQEENLMLTTVLVLNVQNRILRG